MVHPDLDQQVIKIPVLELRFAEDFSEAVDEGTEIYNCTIHVPMVDNWNTDLAAYCGL